MSVNQPTQLTGHEFDGIQEFDNPIPGWWNFIFGASIVFALCYYVYFHVGTVSTTIQDDWQAAQVEDFRRIFGQLGQLKGDEPTVQKMMADPQMLAVARGIFISNCAPCHAKDGGGINGVNLTDDHYKNVKTLPDIFTTITKGANNGAMPTWENRLSTNERVILAAFVASLRGTTPANPKAPEGSIIPPWTAAPATAPADTKARQ